MNQNKKVWAKGIIRGLICFGLILFIQGMIIPCSFGQAWVKPEMVFPDHYPYGFHGMGEIGRVGENDIVIDDAHFALLPDVEFHTLNIENASKAFFRPGMKVGYIIASEKNIKSVWLIE